MVLQSYKEYRCDFTLDQRYKHFETIPSYILVEIRDEFINELNKIKRILNDDTCFSNIDNVEQLRNYLDERGYFLFSSIALICDILVNYDNHF